MYSFNFPNMLDHTSASVISDKEAIKSNMIALLSTERGTLTGDPYFGCQLNKYLFEQSNSIVVDLLIDELYATIITFMPQVYLTRKDITIFNSKSTLYASIRYTYVVDNTSDLFVIKLNESTEQD